MAFAVLQLLEKHLPDLVDYKFTAEMEDELDAISRGERSVCGYLQNSTSAIGTPVSKSNWSTRSTKSTPAR